MAPGGAGALPGIGTVVWTIEVPQEELATTDIVPAVLFGVTVMELVVEEPVHPDGIVQT
jgi:hypothetical protein